MQVSDSNDVKIYNLSAGKSLPEWLSDQKRRALIKKNVDIRRRIELIQDFDMPGLSTSIQISRDGQYVIATGIYKPRIRCFDVKNLSLKFERCFDSEVVAFNILSDDYSKLAFLHCDRYIEFHVAHGSHYRLRVPHFGRDMQYHYPSCDLFVVGASSDIYRLNLERGQFLTPFSSSASSINKCTINPVHNLLFCGTQEGRVEAWDPRDKTKVGDLDCAFNCVSNNKSYRIDGFPSISALKCDGALTIGVGTATGQVLLYDIRSNKPFYVKDHLYGQPIKNVDFHYQQEYIYSMDSQVVKIWSKHTGKLYTSIEASTEFNDLCVVPKTGMLFIANENTKMQTFYIPSLGPAPPWAAFLDSLTEELEESNTQTIYDDYKFVTKQELESLGLDHLLGTNLLRAYMHGYFMNIQLYKKAKSVSDPFAFKDYKKKKIREKIEKERENRVQIQKLPTVNQDLALKLMNEGQDKKKKATSDVLLKDDRFKALFENPMFEINKNTDEYRLLNPVLSKLDKNSNSAKKKLITQQFEEIDDELEGKNSSDESDSDIEDSSDEDSSWKNELRRQHKIIGREHMIQERKEEMESRKLDAENREKQPKFFEIKAGEEFNKLKAAKKKVKGLSLGERISEDDNIKVISSIGNKQITFTDIRNNKKKLLHRKNVKHKDERKHLVRPMIGLKKMNPRFNRRH